MPSKHFVPTIVYEEDDEGEQLGNLPLIHVPDGENMPRFLMMWEARDTGKFEPGPEGEELPIVDWTLRQYARMDVLQAKLSTDDYDKVRVALGLDPMQEAVKKGQGISSSIRDAVEAKQKEVNKSKA